MAPDIDRSPASRSARSDDSLIQALPELVAFIRRDGTILRELGGRRLGLTADGTLAGKSVSDLWPEDIAAGLLQRVRKSLHDRGTSEFEFVLGERRLEARITAHGRDRVLCIIRDALAMEEHGGRDDVRAGTREGLQRRALFERLIQSVADARLQERPLSLLMVHLQGLGELGRVLDFGVVDAMVTHLVDRLSSTLTESVGGGYAGLLGDNVLLVVLERIADRDEVRRLATRLVELLGEPVAVGDATFTVTPGAGVAILGEDGREARELVESARSAMMEARRSGVAALHFFSDTLQLRSMARLDTERELRQAIDEDQLDLRYAARHSLESGALVAVHAYLRWPHPVRGDVAAAEFLPIAEGTGLATHLSAWALARFQRDMPSLRALGTPGMRFSFGALRAHVSSADLLGDVTRLVESGVLAPAELELRFAEKVIAGLAQPGPTLRSLAELGVSIVIDEFGRGFTSLPRLARLPVHALQLDRRLALSAAVDPVARRAAAAALAVAKALDLVPLSAGVDDDAQRRLLMSLGCQEGLGDAFPERFTIRAPAAGPKRRAIR
jgi:predicted signal transduction protein with EAL and GGDEF domain